MKTAKRILLLAALLVSGISGVRAQGWYTGGTLRFWHNEYSGNDSKSTTFTVLPEIGYRWDHWAVGGSLGYTYNKEKIADRSPDAHASALTIGPYARYFFFNRKVVSFYVQAAATASFYFPGEGDNYTDWSCGLRPGIEFHVSEHVNLLATFGFLGYQKTSTTYTYFNNGSTVRYGSKSFGVDLSSSSLGFGFNYTF